MPTGFPCRHSMFFVSIENSPINSEHLRWCLMRKFTTNPFMVQGGIFGTLPSCNGQQIHLLANQLLSANCSFLRRTTFVATHFCIWLPVRGLCMRWSLNHEGTQRRLASVGDTDSVSPLFFFESKDMDTSEPPGFSFKHNFDLGPFDFSQIGYVHADCTLYARIRFEYFAKCSHVNYRGGGFTSHDISPNI